MEKIFIPELVFDNKKFVTPTEGAEIWKVNTDGTQELIAIFKIIDSIKLNNILKMDIKNGYYTFLDGGIIEMISVENGFEYVTKDEYLINKFNFIYDGYSYRLPVKKTYTKCAFKVSSYCLYKEMRFFIDNNNENELLLRPASTEAEIFLGFRSYSYGSSESSIIVNINDILDIWVEREPIEGFKFDIEPIFYIKKDGKYL